MRLTSLTPIPCDTDAIARLALDDTDAAYLSDPHGGMCYRFTAEGDGNTGIAYVDASFTAIAFGGDPQWFLSDNDQDAYDIEAALNGELEDI